MTRRNPVQKRVLTFSADAPALAPAEERLRRQGVDMVSAPESANALAVLRSMQPQAIILDLSAPLADDVFTILDGPEFAEEACVVALSNRAPLYDAALVARQQSLYVTLENPPDAGELVAAVAHCLWDPDRAGVTGERVLLVEHAESVRLAMTASLTSAGYAVYWADSAARADEEIGRSHPDLVLLDLDLPDGDGLALLERIRQTAPQTPRIATASDGLAIDPLVARRAGARAFLPQPLEPDALLGAVRNTLRRAALAQA